MSKFCSNCGEKVDDNSKICPNCGNIVKDKNNPNTKQSKESNTNNNTNFINSFLSNPKLIILIIIIVALIGIFSFAGNIFNNDLVDVTSIEMSVSYTDTPFGGAVESANAQKIEEAENLQYLKENNPQQYKLELEQSGMTEDEWTKYLNKSSTNHKDYQIGTAVTKFSLMPKETITRVTGLRLTNVEVSFDNGGTENWGNFTFNADETYLQDTNYKFSITKTLGEKGENIEKYYKISHIKADIVINTTDEKNLVIGHINEDVAPIH